MAGRIPIHAGPGRFDLAVSYFRDREYARFTIGFGHLQEIVVDIQAAVPFAGKMGWSIEGRAYLAKEWDSMLEQQRATATNWRLFGAQYGLKHGVVHEQHRGWFEFTAPWETFVADFLRDFSEVKKNNFEKK